MLCACSQGQKPSDTLSLYNYSRTANSSRTGMKDSPARTGSLREDHRDDWSDVLMADQSYPGSLSCLDHGGWNPAFDSGIESGTLTFDSTTSASDRVTLNHADVLDKMRRCSSVPVLEFTEKAITDTKRDTSLPLAKAKCSPTGKMYQTYRGQLKIAVYLNYGLLTVHVMEGRHFQSKHSKLCSSYVKVSLMPDDLRRTKCRTEITHNNNEPHFDEKFSFELLEEDVNKRLLVSVWSRNNAHQHSELLGCMSFGIQHILEKKTMANGWYFLLTEHLGKRKHLHVQERRRPLVNVADSSSCLSEPLSPPRERTSDYSGSFCGTLLHVVLQRENANQSYGMTLTGGSPAQIFTIDAGSPADLACLQVGHKVLRVNGQDVSRATSDTVARIIRFCHRELSLEIHKCRSEKCTFEDTPSPTLQHSDSSCSSSTLSSWQQRSLSRRRRPLPWQHGDQAFLSPQSVVLSDTDYTEDETV